MGMVSKGDRVTMTINQKCYVCLQAGGNSEDVGPVFFSKKKADKWCDKKNENIGLPSRLWYYKEVELFQ